MFLKNKDVLMYFSCLQSNKNVVKRISKKLLSHAVIFNSENQNNAIFHFSLL